MIELSRLLHDLDGEDPGAVFALAIACVPDAVHVMDDAGRIVLVNEGFTRLTGYGSEEAIGADVRMLRSGLHHEEVYASMWEKLRSGDRWEGDLVCRWKDGSHHTTNLYITPIRFQGRSLPCFVAVQRAVTRTLHRLDDFFENSVEGIYRSSLDGVIITGNPALVKMLGYDSLAELQAVQIASAMYPIPDERRRYVDKLLQQGIFYAEEVYLTKKDGTPILVQENARVVRDSAGQPLYFEGTLLDLTERRVVERRRFQAQKMESIAQLAGGIAHDFNNLLTGIIGYASVILKSLPGDHPQRMAVQRILGASGRASELTQKLLAFSRQAMLQLEPLDLSSWVREHVPALRRSLLQPTEIDLNLQEPAPRTEADPRHLLQVLQCLIQNASEAVAEPRRIGISTATAQVGAEFTRSRPWAREGHFAVLSVKDSGIGMDESTVKRAFEPFFTTKRDVAGRGLGLSIVYGIIKSHNGMVDIDSRPGGGTTVALYLPLAPSRQPVTTRSKPAPKPGLTTILMVDDEELLLDLGRVTIESAGLRILTAAGGEEGLRLYRVHQSEIGLVLLDLTMPGKGGREVLADLLEYDPGCRVLLSSGYSLDPIISSLLDSGAVGFLQKPYRSEQLLETVQKLLRGDVS